MLRKIVFFTALVLGASASAWSAIWPEEFFGYTRVAVEPASPGDEPVWEEYGFEAGENARYALDGKEFRGTAFRFADATSARAVYLWKKPSDAQPADLTGLSVQWNDGAYFAHGNYVFRFEGFKPSVEQVVGQLLIVPLLEQSPLPSWTEYVPEEHRIEDSRRFITGPEGLEQFEPRVPPSVVGFHYGPEAEIATYSTPAGPLKLTVFNYPTPHIARERLAEFRMLDGAIVKRAGPMLAVVFDPPDPDAAQKLLARVNYRANITWDEYSFKREPTLPEVILTAFLFIGGLFLMALIFGALFGGLKFRRRHEGAVQEDPMIMLHLDDR